VASIFEHNRTIGTGLSMLKNAGLDWVLSASCLQKSATRFSKIAVEEHCVGLRWYDQGCSNYGDCSRGRIHSQFRTALIDLWKGQLFYQPTLSQPDSYKRVDVFELTAYLPPNRNRDQLNIPFRLASKAFHIKIDRILLPRFTFNFDCPKACTHFFKAVEYSHGHQLKYCCATLYSRSLGTVTASGNRQPHLIVWTSSNLSNLRLALGLTV